MKESDRYIVIALALVAVVAGFWFMAISPKRQEASDLEKRAQDLRASIGLQEQTAQFAAQARDDFPKYYGKLVVLGKAVPEDADAASLLVELNSISKNAEVEFRTLKLATGVGEVPDAVPTPAPVPPTTPGETPPPTDPSATATPTGATDATTAVPAAVPTEAAAAALPIGATIGTAGLPILPYELTFRGRFFNMADFFAGLDHLVTADGSKVSTNGRLLTVDGFSFGADQDAGFPLLSATVAVTSYVTPSTQGVTAGASPTAPAPSTPAPVPTSAEVTP